LKNIIKSEFEADNTAVTQVADSAVTAQENTETKQD
jgi:hypothetical protein